MTKRFQTIYAGNTFKNLLVKVKQREKTHQFIHRSEEDVKSFTITNATRKLMLIAFRVDTPHILSFPLNDPINMALEKPFLVLISYQGGDT